MSSLTIGSPGDSTIKTLDTQNREDVETNVLISSSFFDRFVVPYAQLLSDKLGTACCFVGSHIGNGLELGSRAICATAELVYRIVVSPDFDPNSEVYRKELEYLISNVKKLEKELRTISFSSPFHFEKNAIALQKIVKEISETLRMLKAHHTKLQKLHKTFPVASLLNQAVEDYGKIDRQIFLFLREQQGSIAQHLEGVSRVYMASRVGTPSDLYKTLCAIAGAFQYMYREYNLSDRSEITRHCKTILQNPPSDDSPIASHSHEPLSLRNRENNCFINSVLQALFRSSAFCEEITNIQFDDNDPKAEEKRRVQQALLGIIGEKSSAPVELSPFNYWLSVAGFGSIPTGGMEFRDAIFEGGLHHEFCVSTMKKQLDAIDMATLLLDQFLPSAHFHEVVFRNGVDCTDTNTLVAPERLDMLRLNIEEGKETIALEKLIEVNLEHMAPSLNAIQGPDVDKMEHRFSDLPQQLVIGITRFHASWDKGYARKQKVSRCVDLPQNGEIDLTRYCLNTPSGTSRKYKIVSMVRHYGSLDGGHYVADVEKNGKFYHCDDTDPDYFKEISPSEFLSRKDASIIVLERMP